MKILATIIAALAISFSPTVLAEETPVKESSEESIKTEIESSQE